MIDKITAFALTFVFLATPALVQSHCQMPCGIYHDDMVYDQIDQYVETMVKCMSILNNSKFRTVRERNEFVRWVCQKDKMSDDTANIMLTFFIQQKIKPGQADTAKRLESAHKLLFLMVAIKQNSDVAIVDEFGAEWEKFKEMFHVEGYECKIEALKQKKKKSSEIYEEIHEENKE